ncbi:MAG: hypothetical protein CMO80_04790 [Verrucomicrobiales bacterium]|nr:hypothetical protein [Verrucomicrobiales bacterium]
MPRSPLYLNLLLLLLQLALFNIGCRYWFRAERATFMETADRIYQRMSLEKPVDLLFLGDSTMRLGFKPEAFQRRWAELRPDQIRAANCGVGASTGLEHYLALRKSIRQDLGLRAVVYGVFGLRLTDPECALQPGSPARARLEYFLDSDDEATLSAPVVNEGFLPFSISRWIPMYAELGSYWVKVERLRRRMSAWGMSNEARNVYHHRDPVRWVFPDATHVTNHIHEIVNGEFRFTRAIESIISECEANELPLVVLFMPMIEEVQKKSLSNETWLRYMETVRRRLRERGVSMIDATSWIKMSYEEAYFDPLHLSDPGGEHFSKLLAERMMTNRAIADSLSERNEE